jgi:hypothetical protein
MLTNCTVNFLFPLGCSENVEISKKINRLLSLIFLKKITFHQLNKKAHSKTLVWFLRKLQEEDGF